MLVSHSLRAFDSSLHHTISIAMENTISVLQILEKIGTTIPIAGALLQSIAGSLALILKAVKVRLMI
jgi:hypothetical protein